MIDETLDLESETFHFTLTGERVKVIMGALEFSHGFLGGVDVELQEQIVAANNDIADQITQQISESTETEIEDEYTE